MADQTVPDKSHGDIEMAYGFAAVSSSAKDSMDETRENFKELAHFVNDNIPNGREKSLAMTNLQQAKMWAVQALVNADLMGR